MQSLKTQESFAVIFLIPSRLVFKTETSSILVEYLGHTLNLGAPGFYTYGWALPKTIEWTSLFVHHINSLERGLDVSALLKVCTRFQQSVSLR